MRDQVAQLERLSRMKRFFSRAVAEAIVAGGEELLEPHRREITAVFLDLRGFTAFTDRADPDEVMDLLREYHATLGRTVDEFGGTRALRRRRRDDLLQRSHRSGKPGRARDPHGARAAARLQPDRRGLGEARPRRGPRRGHRAGRHHAGRNRLRAALGIRAIGNVPNLAARLCGSAHAGEIILDLQTEQDIVHIAETEFVGALSLRGFQQPVPAFRLKRMREWNFRRRGGRGCREW